MVATQASSSCRRDSANPADPNQPTVWKGGGCHRSSLNTCYLESHTAPSLQHKALGLTAPETKQHPWPHSDPRAVPPSLVSKATYS